MVRVQWLALPAGRPEVGCVIGWPLVAAITAAVTGIAGVAVAYQSYRGYRRNASAPMGWLALAVVLLTVVPVLLDGAATLLPPSAAVLAVLSASSRVGGLLAVLVALTRS